jgi:hypothetical protein
MATTPTELTDECYRCGYALQGIADDQPCPECGLLAQRSRRPSEELYDTHPRWLRRLSRGVWLLLGAIVAVVAAPVVMQIVYWWLPRSVSFSLSAGFYPRSEWVGFDAAVLLLLRSVWLLTSPEGYPPADHADQRLRRWLRWASLPPALGMLIVHTAIEFSLAGGMFGRGSTVMESLFDAAFYLAGIGSIPLPLLLFRRLRDLAKRAHSAHLAEHCTIVGIGASAAIAFAVACSFVSNHADDWFGSYWMSRSRAWILIALVPAVASALFVLWSLYLLVRFAVAFGRASSELRRRWMMQDRSVVIAVQ